MASLGRMSENMCDALLTEELRNLNPLEEIRKYLEDVNTYIIFN